MAKMTTIEMVTCDLSEYVDYIIKQAQTCYFLHITSLTMY